MISTSFPEDFAASLNLTNDGSNDVHMGHQPAEKYRATRLPCREAASVSGDTAEPSDEFNDGSEEIAAAAH